MHTRVVTHYNGKSSYTTIQTYWTWDAIGSEYQQSKFLKFNGVKFSSNKIVLPSSKYIATINESSNIRYVYSGVPDNTYTGTIFTTLKNRTITDKTKFYNNQTIADTLKYLKSNAPIIIFWICWCMIIGLIVFIFYYFDNDWLD